MTFIQPATPVINPQLPSAETLDYRSAGFFVFCGQRLVVRKNQVRDWQYNEVAASIEAGDILFVGVVKRKQIFALSINLEQVEPDCELVDMRDLLASEDRFMFQLIGRALQLLRWENTHRFCGQCGIPTERAGNEIMRYCEPCDLRLYPRVSPCVIMLVHRGDDILLAQRPGTQSTWYTIQAGFIEAGESAEEAVSREIMEETGLTLDSLEYFGSEAWPFPGQLMIGYIAESLEGELTPDPSELANADWFDYRDLPEIPSEHSISGQLIRHFCDQRNRKKD